MVDSGNILQDLQKQFGQDAIRQQQTADDIFTIWISANSIKPAIQYLKSLNLPFNLLYDLCGVDERDRMKKDGLPIKDFTVVYHLFSFQRNDFIRLKVALEGER